MTPWLKKAVLGAIIVTALVTSVSCGRYMNASNANGEYTWKHGPRKVSVKVLGALEFAANDDDLVSLSPDGYLLVEESVLLDSRSLEFTSLPDGSVSRRILFNGEEQALNEETRAWMARILPEVLRRSGVNSEVRANRILNTEGLSGLLQEVGRLPRDHVRERYLRTASSRAALTFDERLSLVKAIGESIGSDSRKSSFLVDLAPRFEQPAALGALLDAGDTIGSGRGKTRLLRALIEQHCDDAANLAPILTSTASVGSD